MNRVIAYLVVFLFLFSSFKAYTAGDQQPVTEITYELYLQKIRPYLNSNEFGGDRYENGQIIIYAVSNKAEKNMLAEIRSKYLKVKNIKFVQVDYSIADLGLVINEIRAYEKEFNIWNMSIDYQLNAVAIEMNRNASFSPELKKYLNSLKNGKCVYRKEIVVKVEAPPPDYIDKIKDMKPSEYPQMTQDDQKILSPIRQKFIFSDNEYGGMCFLYDTLYIFTVNEDSVREKCKAILPESLKVEFIKTSTSIKDLKRVEGILEQNKKKYNIRNISRSLSHNSIVIDTYDDTINEALANFIKSDPNGSCVVREDYKGAPALTGYSNANE